MNRLFILGSGAPFPTPERYGSSYILTVGSEHLMFDCGPATTYKMVRMGISPTDVDHLFFTHHHFDHDIDYPCFLFTRWDMGAGQENLLNVYGPRLTERLTERILDEDVGAFAHDWIARINHPLSLSAYTSRGGVLPRRPPNVRVTDIGPGRVLNGRGWEVTAASAVHVQPYLDSLAFRVDTDDGSFVFTGDTAPCDSLLELACDADVLVLNCVGIDDEMQDVPDLEYMTGTAGAGKLAQEAGVKELVIVHNRRIGQPGVMERAVADVAKYYDGQIVMGTEFMEVPLDHMRMNY
jgi:ribonuclease BN (tRNA processing enzyme)